MSTPTPEIYVFQSPGMRPDVRLTIFDTEFHVHRVILALRSRFFQKAFVFGGRKPTPGIWEYEFVSRVDDDGTWGLNLVTPENKNIPSNESRITTCKYKPERETKAFGQLLMAMYNRRCDIEVLEQLEDLFRLADEYLALPAVSTLLDSALWGITLRKAIQEIGTAGDPRILDLLIMAKRLRQPILFREMLGWVVGHWSSHGKEWINVLRKDHPNILLVVLEAYSRLWEMLSRTDSLVAKYLRDNCTMQVRRALAIHYGSSEESLMSKARYYRIVADLISEVTPGEPDSYLPILKVLYRLLENTLPLLSSSHIKTDCNAYDCKNIFLCAAWADVDLPWDPNEIDW